MKKLALAVIGVIALSSAAMAKPDREPNIDRLQLTQEQSAQMKSLHESMQKEREATHAAHQAEMKNLLENPTFNADQARKMHQKHRDDRAVQKLQHKHAVYQVLTPEQRAEYLKAHDGKGPRMNHDGKGHKGHRQHQ
ncbi:Spy/CpxP family protein refolding chaperone [Wohlfahrtiimonas chitiniclastica]|uniref:Spy/CpxP family protein refolding chaperone n=1 Tax=Wohlfahrtiimonas chitiniclastica TaxID=400946 RepID=UPI001BD03C97|nr:Spy/CpxP family protein refolding chaperone [Wohlfahrtiimonas chitiniclastica]MBS7835438.1 Spy/CpxP family protein refolding chaperone [Wohlfahrtiimonas chitiniclastica]